VANNSNVGTVNNSILSNTAAAEVMVSGRLLHATEVVDNSRALAGLLLRHLGVEIAQLGLVSQISGERVGFFMPTLRQVSSLFACGGT
jgi:hypothetical protein